MKNVEDLYRLSPCQRELLRQAVEGSGLALEYLHWDCHRELDEAALEQALRELVGRHTALRTGVLSEGLSRPVQVVREHVEVRLERAPWQRDWLEQQRQRQVVPSAAPLVRLVVLRASATRCTLAFGYHPLVLDEASARLCIRELWQLYAAARGQAPAALEPAMPYRHYLAWLEQQDARGAEARLAALLRGIEQARLPETTLAAQGAPVRRAQQLALPAHVAGAAQALAGQHGIGIGTLLQAAWALLLGQQAPGGEVLFGALASGRPASLPGSGALVGRLATPVPRRLTLPRSGPRLRWLKDLQAALESARELEPLLPPQPFQSLVSAEVSAEEASLHSLARSLGFHGLARAPSALPCPLVAEALAGPGLTLRLSYEARRFEAAALAHLLHRLGRLLEALACRPEEDVAGLASMPAPRGHTALEGSAGPEHSGLAVLRAVLAQHPEVREVAVAPGEGGALDAWVVPHEAGARRRPRLGLFFFANEEGAARERYRLYLEAARFADRQGLATVWTPERHFDMHGGLYPNPSVLSAALATMTERVALRAGSVVLPLHHPLRVAEEWAVVDNLSGGRAGLAITAGWHPQDFALAPERFAHKREALFQSLEEVRRLWRGGTLRTTDGAGNKVELRAYPRPVQPELPVWLTCPLDPALFERAGELGCHVLTSLLGQSEEELGEKIQRYRAARARVGLAPESGQVAVMVHTHLGSNTGEVLERVRGPLARYLRSHLELHALRARSMGQETGGLDAPGRLEQLAALAVELHARSSALIGTPLSCLPLVERLAALGVDELACFIDFGVEAEAVLAGLEHVAELQRLAQDEQHRLCRLLAAWVEERLPGWQPPLNLHRVETLPASASSPGSRVS